MTPGALTLFRFRGVPIRAHWTLPLVALFISGLRFAPGAWGAWVLVVMLHEMGHAFWALRYRLDVIEIVLNGFGGHCRYAGSPTPRQRAVVAWGGVMAQAIVFAIALPLSRFVPAETQLVSDAYRVLIVTNLYVALLNLIPIPPLDGAEAWKLVPMLLRRAPTVARAEIVRARAKIEPRSLGEAVGPVDENAVRDTVRRALDEARRDSRDPGAKKKPVH
jgi:Zn-dependent protease